ncbi:MAG: S8 family serine peptidase [bacterium]|nr:S8 family serine peptidase [bacterium]
MRQITLFLLLTLTGWSSIRAAELSPLLPDVLAASKATDDVPVIVYLDHRLTMDEVYPEAKALPMDQRRAYVVEVLKERFAQMSGKVMSDLQDAEKRGEVTLLRPLWIINSIRLKAQRQVIDRLVSDYPEVIYISHDPAYENTLDNGWGVIETGTPAVWAQYGARGQGVLVGHKDSGVNFAGCAKFNGRIWFNPGEDLNGNGVLDAGETNSIDDDGNGYADDFYGWNFDDNNNDVSNAEASYHGTRTASVICSNVGVSVDDTVAMAPEAKLLVLRSYITQGSVFESSQYAVEMGVNVISASLSFKQSECTSTSPDIRECPNRVGHRWISEMELAAGIIHSNSTGNAGTSNVRPMSCAAPSDCPPPAMTDGHDQQGGVSSIVAVAGYNADGSFYNQSGVGPSAWSRQDICVQPRMPWCGPAGTPSAYPAEFEDYPWANGSHGLLKPDISSPTSVQSVSGTCGTSSIGGTSGATPHVGGALAVIYSAFPGITPEEVYQVLVGGALDAGDFGPDTTWGFGKLRMPPAIGNGMDDMGSVAGTVTANPGGQALDSVRITVAGAHPVWTDEDGAYQLFLMPGEYIGSFEKFGYGRVDRQINIAAGQVDEGSLTMSQVAGANLLVTVFDPNGVRTPDVQVRHPLSGITIYTDANGEADFQEMYVGVQEFVAGDNIEMFETAYLSQTLTPEFNTLRVDLGYSELVGPTSPDAYGYMAYDDLDFGGPVYDWVEIADGLGTELPLTADGCVSQTLPFSMQFYGVAENEIMISANGHVEVGTPCTNNWSRWPIPLTGAPDNYIAAFFQDFRPENGGGVWYYEDTGNGRVIIQWDDVPEYWNDGRATFQLQIYNPAVNADSLGNSIIEIMFEDYTGRVEAAIGIENSDGSTGVQYEFQLHYAAGAAPVRDGRAIRFTTDDPPASAGEEPIGAPREFTLLQNYPNPFNSQTTFRFHLPQQSPVTLKLFDIMGREVATLASGSMQAGEHSVSFDAENLATGIYFARLDALSGVTATRKVLLLK